VLPSGTRSKASSTVGVLEESQLLSDDALDPTTDRALLDDAAAYAEAVQRYRDAAEAVLKALKVINAATREHAEARANLQQVCRQAKQPNRERTVGRAFLDGDVEIRRLVFQAQELGIRPAGLTTP
jgi:hypothetical protein